MFNNKKVNIILSLIIAIGLWAYVIGEINPQTSQPIKEIPITFVNEKVLEAQGLSIVEASATSLNVTVYGQRSKVTKIKAKDIVATVDLAEATEGVNQLKINIHLPEKVEIEEKSISKISVVVEKTVSEEKDVEVSYKGPHSEDSEPTTVDYNRRKITVTGAKSLVGKVDHIQCIVDSNKVGNEMKTFKAEAVPVDAKGNPVENIDLSSNVVSVTSVLRKTKTVSLIVPIKGGDSQNAERNVSLPKVVTIKGMEKDIAGIKQITAKEIDISQIYSNTHLTIEPILPENVELAETSKQLIATINVESYVNKAFNFRVAEVTIDGLEEDRTAEIKTDEIQVTVTGKDEIISKMTKDDLVLYIDLSDLEVGNHKVELKVQSEKKYNNINVSPTTVKVSIE